MEPPKYEPYKIIPEKVRGGYSFIVLLNDLHYGNRSNKKNLFWGKSHSTEYVVDAIKKYGAQIESDIKNLNLKIDSIVIVSLGDILHTANTFGTTTKGTPLRFDVLSEEMFEIAFDSLSELVYNLSKLAPRTKVYSYKGNHSAPGTACYSLRYQSISKRKPILSLTFALNSRAHSLRRTPFSFVLMVREMLSKQKRPITPKFNHTFKI